jgi:hypothetical protein
MEKLLLTAGEVAGLLGIGRTKTYELIAGGRLASVNLYSHATPTMQAAAVSLLDAVSGSQRGSQAEDHNGNAAGQPS